MRPSLRLRTCIVLFATALTLALLGGCLRAPEPSLPLSRPHIDWESADARLMLTWLGEVRTPGDLGIRPTWWGKLRALLTGDDDFRLLRPYGLDHDESGQLCIADPGARAVYCFDTAKNRLQTLRGTAETDFLSPIDLARSEDGTLFITDSTAAAIYAVPRGAERARLFARMAGGRPTGIAYSRRQQLLFVADTTSHQVVVFDLQGRERLRFGTRGTAAGEFNYPTDLTIDAENRVLITDSLNARVQIFSVEGIYLGQFGTAGRASGEFGKPKGIAATSSNYRVVCDAELDRIQIFDPQGQPVLLFGLPGEGPGEFLLPTGIFIDSDDLLWIADSFNQRVQYFRFSAAGGTQP